MPRCARDECGRWRPDILVRRTAIGMRLDGLWYCSPGCLEASARERLATSRRVPQLPGRMAPLRLGTLLLHRGVVTADALRAALAAQKTTGLKIGAQLVAMGAASSGDIVRALATQSGVRCLTHVDVSCVREAPGRLSADAIRALGLVPIESDAELQRLRVACAAPVPRTATAALYELTGWTIEPLLVSDEHMESLLLAYEEAVGGRGARVQSHRAADVEDVTAHVVRAASGSGDVRMSQARMDPFLWVRLESGSAVEDVLLALDGSRGDASCQAAHT
jgi:hypothetical protein